MTPGKLKEFTNLNCWDIFGRIPSQQLSSIKLIEGVVSKAPFAACNVAGIKIYILKLPYIWVSSLIL